MTHPNVSARSPQTVRSDKDKPFRHALGLFREASRRVPAYVDFLKKAKVKPELIKKYSDFVQVPLTDKQNYVSKYDIEDLSWDGALTFSRYISSSSGSTGVPFYWPRGRKQDIMVGSMFRRIYEEIFGTKRGRTLALDSFALGAWIAGLEFFNATKWTADMGSNIVLVTPGIDKTIAVDEIRRLSSSFDRIVIAGYPPFVKDILEYGAIEGIVWQKHDVRLLTGGESISEKWRDRVLEIIGRRDPHAHIINMYGMAETGIVGFETPLSIAVRRGGSDAPALDEILNGDGNAYALYQYDPMIRYFEKAGDDSLILTTDAGFPLVRYDTRDSGGLLGYDHVIRQLGAKTKNAVKKNGRLKTWQFPFVYLKGRRDLSISLYALNIYVENVKNALEGSKFASHLSGLFTMSIEHTPTLDQQFAVTIELSRGTEPSGGLTEALTRDIVENLCSLNTEYAKLFSVIGERAKPQLTLVKFGEIQTAPGRKHKWIKR